VAAVGPSFAVTPGMRALVTGVIAVTVSAVAAADPQPAGLTDPLNTAPTAAATEPMYQVQLAGEIATIAQQNGPGGNYAAAGAEAAIRVFHSSLWLRLGVMAGNATPSEINCPLNAPCNIPSQSMYELRAGLDARACGLPAANPSLKNLVCWFAGIDVVDMSVSYMSNGSGNVLALPHLGFDTGSRHVRARIALELGWGGQGEVAAGLDAGIGYLW
jgi:hypothetical protein